MSITVAKGITFTNWGPVTTTFTAPASCTSGLNYYGIGLTELFPDCSFQAQCTQTDYNGCVPTGTVSEISAHVPFVQTYYSPGLYCPSEWKTAGVAARHGDKTVSMSGVFTMAGLTETEPWATDMASSENAFTVLAELLDSSETLVLCCPSSMTADIDNGCYSVVPDYKVTTACGVFFPASAFSTSTETYTVNGTTSLGLYPILSDPHRSTIITTTIAASETSTLGAVSYMPMLRLIHHQSDLKATGTAEAGSTTATSTSNSAARVAPNVTSQGGLGGILGASLAAIALGAVMVLL
ncbi:hypothetical protein N7463_001450 [Penicillium fimorum]|uniref:Uncharacterized protein n=1 Tax=Penicillium fimorum TaxID=1882269 RepID=A0A9W9Y659_9EURO|nr:hypothetical protein N7463_001450 [Penicillium fimorum]